MMNKIDFHCKFVSKVLKAMTEKLDAEMMSGLWLDRYYLKQLYYCICRYEKILSEILYKQEANNV